MTKHDFRLTPQDHERMKEALDNLSDNPTEEEAEAVLQACGTSGKEVVNEFIERLLKENLGLKQELARRAAVAGPPEALMRATNLCRSGIAGEQRTKVELLFDDLKDAQAVHQWLVQLKTAAPAEMSDAGIARLVTSLKHTCGCTDHDAEVCLEGEVDEGQRYCHCNCHAPNAPAESTRAAGEQESTMKTIDWLGDMEIRHIGPLEARNRDKAQEIILATEAALSKKFDGIARHELVNRITVALNAAAPAANDTDCTCDDLTEVQRAQGDHYDDCPHATKEDR